MNQNKKLLITSISLVVVTASLAVIGWCQVRVLDNTARKQLRAYVLPTSFQDSLDLGRLKEVSWYVKNFGQTPAYEVHPYAVLYWADSVLLDPRYFGIDTTMAVTLGPGEPSIVLTALGPGNGKTLFLVGKITYRDIFEEFHMMTFCFFYAQVHKGFFQYPKFNQHY